MDREAMKQPEALRLADALDDESTQGRISNYNGRKAAVELRRLHDLVCVCGAVWEGGMMVHPPRKREWVGLTLNEAEDFYDKYTDRAELINAIDKFLEEKNNG
jgi:hypothetical protein